MEPICILARKFCEGILGPLREFQAVTWCVQMFCASRLLGLAAIVDSGSAKKPALLQAQD